MVAAKDGLLLEDPPDGEGYGDDPHGLVDASLGVRHAGHVAACDVVVVGRYLLELLQHLLLHQRMLGHQVQQEVEAVV